MSKLTWGKLGDKEFETGVQDMALYVFDTEAKTYSKDVAAWNGVESVTESPEGAEASDFYADNVKYASLRSAETFGCSIEAYASPKEFDQCDGSAEIAPGVNIGQQERAIFGLSYKTNLGNDAGGQNAGYKLHLIYGCTASPSEKSYSSVNDSPDLLSFSWDINTTPVAVTGHKPTASLTINSLDCDAEKLAALEAILYGSENTEPRLPLPDEVAQIMTA